MWRALLFFIPAFALGGGTEIGLVTYHKGTVYPGSFYGLYTDEIEFNVYQNNNGWHASLNVLASYSRLGVGTGITKTFDNKNESQYQSSFHGKIYTHGEAEYSVRLRYYFDSSMTVFSLAQERDFIPP